MNIVPTQIQLFKVFFETSEHVPPPYFNRYSLEIVLGEPSLVTYEIQYPHREDLSEDEIIEEGFTTDDDWSWKGTLPPMWSDALLRQIEKQSWPKKPVRGDNNEAILNISLFGSGNQMLFEGRPADLESWDYFLQELSQAIFETAEKEAPFFLHYREISSGNDNLDIQIEASFARREITAKKTVADEQIGTANPGWNELKHILKLVYLPDYDYDRAKPIEPKKRGKYLLTGEGLWFKFGESLLEPDKKSNSLLRLENMLKGFFEKE